MGDGVVPRRNVGGMMDIIEKLLDLYKQATQERTHYYTATCISEAIAEIEQLRTALTSVIQTARENHQQLTQTRQANIALVSALKLARKYVAKAHADGVQTVLPPLCALGRIDAALEKG